MTMHRLFVAATPPAAIRAALVASMGGVPGARWQSDTQLHITLRFIGEVDRHRAEDVAVALGHVRHPAITPQLGACGSFDRQGRIDTLWVGTQPRDCVASLHDAVDRALAQAGVSADARAFLPHITLARFPRSAAPTAEVAQQISIAPLPPFVINRITLFESRLGAEGASYEAIARYPLG